MHPKISRTLLASLLIIAIFALNGCASYKLGNEEAELPFKTLYVSPATNQSFLPQAQAPLSIGIRDAFIRDGRVRLVTKEENADAILDVNISDYNRKRASRSSADTTEAIDFDLKLTADISLYSTIDRQFLFENREVSQRTNAYLNNPYIPDSPANIPSFTQSEYDSVPRLGRDLGRAIADEVLSVW